MCAGIQQKCRGLFMPDRVGAAGQSVQIWHLWLWSSDFNFVQLNWSEVVQRSQTQVGWGTGEWGCKHPWAVQSSSVINHASADSYHFLFWVTAQSPVCDISSPFPLEKPTGEFSDSSVGMDTHNNTYLEGSESKKVAVILLFSHQMQPHL